MQHSIVFNKVLFEHSASPLTFEFDFHIDKNLKYMLSGKSGIGKSTLLNLIAGFLKPIAGDIFIEGQKVTHLPPNKRNVAFLFQDNNLFEHLNVFDNVAIALAHNLKLDNSQKATCDNILEKLKLHELKLHKPHEISGGQRQRVAIARIMLLKRPILLLDEPLAALDEALRFSLLELICDLCSEYKITMIIVSHHEKETSIWVDRTLTIEDKQDRRILKN